MIEFVDVLGGHGGEHGGEEGAHAGRAPHVPPLAIEELLRAAGIDVKGLKKPPPTKDTSARGEDRGEGEEGDGKVEENRKAKEKAQNHRDEL